MFSTINLQVQHKQIGKGPTVWNGAHSSAASKLQADCEHKDTVTSPVGVCRRYYVALLMPQTILCIINH